MTPDPQRQWFVYHQEKELGPLPESEVLKKLRSREIDDSAFVYTEGMSDWALVSDTSVLRELAPNIAGGDFESVGQTGGSWSQAGHSPAGNGQAKRQTQPGTGGWTGQQGTGSQAVQPQLEPSAAPAAAKTGLGGRFKKQQLRPIILAVLIAVLLGVGYFAYMNRNTGGTDPDGATVSQETKSNPKPGAAPLPADAAPPASDAVDWPALETVRRSTDGAAAPFVLGQRQLPPGRVLLVGAINKAIVTESVTVAIYPDNDKNLMVIPRVWILRVPVIDGYFSVGPLHIEGAPLPEGRYFLVPQANGRLLGEADFEVGAFPGAPELANRTTELQKQRIEFAAKERSEIEGRFQDLSALQVDLEKIAPGAQKGPKSAVEWKKISTDWRNRLRSLATVQYNQLLNPLFYSTTQTKIYNLIVQMDKFVESLNRYSTGGLKSFMATTKKAPQQFLVEIAAEKNRLTAEIGSLATASPGPLRVDVEQVRKQLLEAK